MGNQWRSLQSHTFTKKFLHYVLYAIFPIILLRLYFYPSPHLSQSPVDTQFSSFNPMAIISTSLSSSPPPKEIESVSDFVNPVSLPTEDKGSEILVSHPALELPKEKDSGNNISYPESNQPKDNETDNETLPKSQPTEISSTCDYSTGEWIQDKRGPLYNGSSCGTIKEGQNCMSHGRPDKDYLDWRWKPNQCKLPRFNPESFLQILKGKHLAVVGDSMARNQLESLLCMLASVSPPNLIYRSGEDNKFRRWHFPSHNVNVSLYWSPFLVKGVEKMKDETQEYNQLHFDSVDERWASDLDSIDMVVLSIGHWYLHPAYYFDGETLLGCHAIQGKNCTEIGFYDVFGKAFNTTLKTIIQRKGSSGNPIDVIVTTFSPHHFEGDWDKLGACPKTKPYMEGEKVLEGMDADMRKAEIAEVESVRNMLNGGNSLLKVRIAALDVTKLALMRPDGHPGPYMYPFPFADGIKDRVQNDCVHWCLPGPIDTWNEIMLDIMTRWHISSKR